MIRFYRNSRNMTDINLTPQEVFNFPCDYSIKVFGKDSPPLKNTVCTIIERHTGKLKPNQIKIKRSSKGAYISFSIRIIATSRAQIDVINQTLKDCPLVAYIL